MKNIGVILDNELYGDARVLNECKILSEAGHNVFVLCFNYGKYKNFEKINGYQVHRIQINHKIRNILFAFNNSVELYNHFWKRKIKNFIKKNNIDTLHVHDLYMSKSAYYATKRINVNFTLDLHENYPAAVKGYKWMYKLPFRLLIRPNKWTLIEKRYLNYADNIVVLSEPFKNNLVDKYKGLSNKRFVIYPNVPDISEFNTYKINTKILTKNENDFILFYFGGISKRRGIFVVIEALEQLVKINKNIKLLLIGPIDKAEKEEFLKLFQNPSILDHIIYYEWKDISLLPSYITISDICLSPIEKNDQHESGVANKIFQYMLFERPLIVSNCRPQEKVIIEENCGLVYKHDDARDLENKILELYQNPNLRKTMGINGKKAIEEKYNTDIAGENLVNLYN